MHMSQRTTVSSGTAAANASRNPSSAGNADRRLARARSRTAATSTHGSRGPASSSASASQAARASPATITSGAQFFAASASSTLIATSRGGAGIRQFWVIVPSRSLPTATTRSASSHSAPISGTCGGSPSRSGWPAAIPFAEYVVTIGAPRHSASEPTAALAPAATAPPPTHTSGLRAPPRQNNGGSASGGGGP